MREAEISEQSVKARQRWFISTAEAERIQRPQLAPQDRELGSDGETLPPQRG
jgi:hypothetical protein